MTAHKDSGFTLAENLVAVAIITIVMAGLGVFFINAMRTTRAQGERQTAVRISTDALERARALGPNVNAGRSADATLTQWQQTVPDSVRAELVTMQRSFDAAPDSSPPLPTAPEPVEIDGVEYTQRWYVGTCWKPRAAQYCLSVANVNDIKMYKVVVTLTWASDQCPTDGCVLVNRTFVNPDEADPVF
jgi:prepilin-type N-terminal cleavage/methylation domain-containing protein